jgi:hypothetical protein
MSGNNRNRITAAILAVILIAAIIAPLLAAAMKGV